MSEVLDNAVSALEQKLGDGSFNGSVRFDIEGAGSVRLDGGSVSIDDSDADCTISASVDTFEGMMAGDINPTTAFMTGKLKVDGDMSKAMALASVLA